jgi:hypothetical protein
MSSDQTGGGNGNSQGSSEEGELIAFPTRASAPGQSEAGDIAHLADHRALIVRRSLLATAVGGLVPVPVMDDYLAGRVRAGMLMKLAERRRVDIVTSSAERLTDPREGTAVRNATMTAATILAFKLAWKKFFVLLAVGRRAEEMATTFQIGTLFDHYCAKLHVGSGIDRETSMRLRHAMLGAIRDTERTAVVDSFREGADLLTRSLGEAPRWMSRRFQKAMETYVATGGNPDAVADAVTPELDPEDPEEEQWLDRAATRVETRLGQLGQGYVRALLGRFEGRWNQDQTLVR